MVLETSDKIAIAALVVSAATFFFGLIASCWMSIKPDINIFEDDYKAKTGVRIRSCGNGRVKITKMRIVDTDKYGKRTDKEILSLSAGDGCYINLIDAMPSPPKDIMWTDYAEAEGRILAVGEDVYLVLLKGDPTNLTYQGYRDQARKTLGDLTVLVQYEDATTGFTTFTLREDLKYFLENHDK